MTLAYAPPATPAADVAHHCDKGSRDCFPHDLTSPSADGRGSGRIATAPLPQCGGHDEDSKDCSREGRQSPAGGWYQLRLGGYEPVTYDDGTVNREYVWEKLTVALPDELGFAATVAALRATAAAHRPDMEMLNYWGIEAPAEEF